MFNTPILFIIFNRPDTTIRVFEEIRKQQPRQLFIAADGQRPNRPGEAALSEESRRIALNIDWPCEVKTLFREKNLGCGKAVSSAITWFFENVEEGIILEDDCLPHPDFFRFCIEMLECYRHDNSIMHIGGGNFQNGKNIEHSSYYFSQIAHVWGWASWRRAWKLYDFNITDFLVFCKSSRFPFSDDTFVNEKLMKIYADVHNGKIDTWDYQWTFSIQCNKGFTIIPKGNLVSNIGFGCSATHTKDENSKNSCIPITNLDFPLKHPRRIKMNKSADLRFYRKEYNYKPITRRLLEKIKSITKRIILK